ncbi:Uncharacterized protein AArcCO_1900 [Halalkaliarchaeum sp. AArc-CO]|uniref:DUF5789 family protein n=1 Tax=unclassified Halalkaliarchaeum TaxID=2678344 RepID=UPI00217E1DFD|nr:MULTISPECIES: hypothetical protein [unclassified Halalkaliarchaeum]MDR5671701.1 hypothetical protein [Halalkaliarchaeum sp. AArc-GB]UWG51198.1 Uncharacterized protein AArcCO_1900 [Halalkaliarchaeum sp. AArc-CO]
MAVRPPGDGSDPDHIEFGIAALAARLEEADLEYPATADEICTAVDNTDVPYDGSGNTLELREGLAELETEQFESEAQLLEEIHPVFERRRRAAGGIFDRIRGLLPF